MITRALPATVVATAVMVAAFLLIPARHAGALDPWFGVDSSDALRYITMANGGEVEYPWGGRWSIPWISSLFGDSATTVLRVLNYVFAFAATTLITYSAAKLSGSYRAVAAAWLFTATGAAYTLLFQNPYLLDSAGLLVIALIGFCYLRHRDLPMLALILIGVTVKEVVIGFLVLLLFRRQWALFSIGAVASCALLAYGVHSSPPGSALFPEPGFGIVVKGWFGFGAGWVLILAGISSLGLYIARSSHKAKAVQELRSSGPAQYFATVVVIALASLPLATDTSRLLVFALPATLPITAVVLSKCTRRTLLIACGLAVPAVFVVLPTRVSFALKPEVLTQLEEWYAANIAAIFVATVLSTVGACIAARPLLARSPSRVDALSDLGVTQ
ncbi:hypothetical protein [Rhodococcoides fascians]|uniref:hypothetical protein n=1 Tax=Rhodococcoides fascians TaxID=1828 RepID=UPI0005663D2A|nr:hypothetical protein [Rhodococcus fascians]